VTPAEELLRAVDFARAGEWHEAHEIAQRHEGQPTADWLHGVLHALEGDAGNARYWFRRAGRTEPADPAAELAAIRDAVAARAG